MSKFSGLKLSFEAAHRGPFHTQVHGHSWTVEVSWPSSLVGDLYARREELALVIAHLDHKFLDDVVGLSTPTGEGITDYLLDCLPGAARVRVERPTIGFFAEASR